MDELHQYLRQHELFRHLTSEQSETLIRQGRIQTFDRNHTVIHATDTEPDLYLLLEGMCKNSILTDDGNEKTVRFYVPGDLAGMISAVNQKNMNFTVQTVEKSRFFVIPHHLFQQCMHQNVSFAEMVAKDMSNRLHNLYRTLHHEFSYQATGMDPYPFRKKIGEIMTSPVVTMSGNPSVMELARHMADNRVSSVVLTEKDTPVKAIVTEKDILRSVAENRDLQKTRADNIVTGQQILFLSPDAFFYEALLMMVKHRIKHIPVVHNQHLVGMVTMHNLTRARGMAVLSIVDEIEHQTSIEGLSQARRHVRRFLDAMLKENAAAHEICAIISELNDRILRRIILLCEQEMVAEHKGPPPVEYCWLAMGSEGRKEQTLATDQDNAIIFMDVEPAELELVDQYFAQLAEKIVSGLEQCGFPRCEGGVMAVNRKWRRSLSEWKREINHWLNNLDGDEVRNFTIFLDFRGVYGHTRLAEELRQHLHNQAQNQTFLFNRLARDDSSHPVPIGLFGRFITEKNEQDQSIIDLKHGGVMHIVNAARIFALREGITQASTTERLHLLKQAGVYNEREHQEISEAFNTLMSMRILLNMEQQDQGQPLNNNLPQESLSREDKLKLKKSLSTVKWVQQMIQRHFHVQ